MTVYPSLTKEEFVHFVKCDKDFVKRYNLTMSLTRRVGRGLRNLCICKFDGMFGFEKNPKEALQHYDKACMYDPETKNLPIMTKTMECYRHEQNSTS
jgi:hypothetical protein